MGTAVSFIRVELLGTAVSVKSLCRHTLGKEYLELTQYAEERTVYITIEPGGYYKYRDMPSGMGRLGDCRIGTIRMAVLPYPHSVGRGRFRSGPTTFHRIR